MRKRVRGMVIFGQHDLGQRAPFPRIDLVLCRNVLIYFLPELQRRALQLFAFALRDGGGTVHTQFLTGGLADELQLVVAPFFVGDSRATRFVGDGRFPWNPGRRATLAEVRQIGDVVLLRYALSSRFQCD